MRRRIGNVLTITWPIKTNGESTTLEERDIKLYLKTPRSGSVPAEFAIHLDVVEYRFLADVQQRYGLGDYGLTLVENEGTTNQAVIDACKFITLVDCSCKEDTESTLVLPTGMIEVGVKGDKGDKGDDGRSAYEVAVDNGFVGTEEEWLASLHGKPGTTDFNELDNNPFKNGTGATTTDKKLTLKVGGFTDTVDTSNGNSIPNIKYVGDKVREYDKDNVKTSGDQTIDGVKTFNATPILNNGGTVNKVEDNRNAIVNKGYVDDIAAEATQAFGDIDNVLNGFTPTWNDLINGLQVEFYDSSEGTVVCTPHIADSSSGLRLTIDYHDRYKLLDIPCPTNLDEPMESLHLYQNGGFSGTITNVTYNGKEVITDKPLPYEFDYHHSETALDITLQFGKMGLIQRVEALEDAKPIILTLKEKGGGYYDVTSSEPLREDAEYEVFFANVRFHVSVAYTGSYYFNGVYSPYGSNKQMRMRISMSGDQLDTAIVTISELVEEAPKDDKQYVRQNGAWEENAGGSKKPEGGWTKEDLSQDVQQTLDEAGNVNATLDGYNITVTDKHGVSVTQNIRGEKGEQGEQGEKGDKGDSVTMFPNVTIFGQPTIQESQISNFSVTNYLQFPFVVDFAGRPWQIDCCITTGADVSQQHNIFDSNFGLAFAFSGGKFVMALSSNGTSWNLGAPSGTHSILPNTTYYVRISWDGSRYVLAYSTDKEAYIEDIVVNSTDTLYSRQIIIGKDMANLHPYNGSINFAECKLAISGKIVWEGMDDAGLATRMAIDMSNIDDEGKQKVREIAESDTLSLLYKRGVISQKQTWASDYSRYTMSNQVYGIIPQANIDLFASAGAEFNDTNQSIAKTAPWGETVQHLPGYFYLNGLGDISYVEMESIYLNGCEVDIFKNCRRNSSNARTFWSMSNDSTQWYGVSPTYNGDYSNNKNLEVVTLSGSLDTGVNTFKPKSLWRAFDNDVAVRHIGIIDCSICADLGNFLNCYALINISLYKINKSVKFAQSSWLSTASILYMITNSAATTQIIITLHPDAYARAMEDEDVNAALADKPLVTLASA